MSLELSLTVERQVSLFASEPWHRGSEVPVGVVLDPEILLGNIYPAWITLRSLAEKVEEKSESLAEAKQDSGGSREAWENLHRLETKHYLDKLVRSDLFQGHERPVGDEIEGAEIEEGIYYLLNQRVDSVATGAEIAGYTIRKLHEHSRYDVLGSEKFQDALDSFAGQYISKQDQQKIKSEAVNAWVEPIAKSMGVSVKRDDSARGYKQMFEIFSKIRGLESHLQTPSEIDFSQVKYPPTFFSWSKKRQVKWIEQAPEKYRRQYERKTARFLHEITESPILSGKRGLLKMRVPTGVDSSTWPDSDIQQKRVFLLSLPNLSVEAVEKILARVQELPNISRAMMGKVPAAMIARVMETVESWPVDRAGKEEFEKKWIERANHGWPTPAEMARISLPHKENTVVYDAAVTVRKEYIKACIEKGWAIPSLRDYLPKEVLNDGAFLRELVKKRAEHALTVRKGWNAPLRRESDGRLYDSLGREVDDPVKKSEPVKPSDRGEVKTGLFVETVLRFAPSLGMALLAWHKSSKL